MKNKNVGFLVIGISIVMAVLVIIFNTAMRNTIELTCTHGPDCPMYTTLSLQTWISLSIVGIILIIGLFLIFSKESEKIVIKKINSSLKKTKPIDYNQLDKEEKVLVKNLEQSEGTMFQADLVEKSGFDKVKVSRILDRLEGKQIIERKRRGLTNIVILKVRN